MTFVTISKVARQTLQRTKLFTSKTNKIMMDFISIPLVVGICVLGVYKLFELFVRKRERLNIIDKIGDKFDPSMIDNKFSFPDKQSNITFSTLKIGCLLLGVGLGLLIGFFISYYYYGGTSDNYYVRDVVGVIYGASVLLFGGVGLLTAFIIEMKMLKK